MSDEQLETKTADSAEQITDSEEKAVYELAYHIVPTLADDERAAQVDTIRKVIEDAGGLILNDVYPEHLELAYTMTKPIAGKLQRFSTAFFGWIDFELHKAKIEEIKEACDKDDTLVRFLITTTTKELAMTQTRPAFKKEQEPAAPVAAAPAPEQPEVTEEAPKEEMSEEEVDKAIDDLVEEPVTAS